MKMSKRKGNKQHSLIFENYKSQRHKKICASKVWQFKLEEEKWHFLFTILVNIKKGDKVIKK